MTDRDQVLAIIKHGDFARMMDTDCSELSLTSMKVMLHLAMQASGPHREALLDLVSAKLTRCTDLTKLATAVMAAPARRFVDAVCEAHGVTAFTNATDYHGTRVCPLSIVDYPRLEPADVEHTFTRLKPAVSSAPYDLITYAWNCCSPHDLGEAFGRILDLYEIPKDLTLSRMIGLSPWKKSRRRGDVGYPGLQAWAIAFLGAALDREDETARLFLSQVAVQHCPWPIAFALHRNPWTWPEIEQTLRTSARPDDWTGRLHKLLSSQHGRLRLHGALMERSTEDILDMSRTEVCHLLCAGVPVQSGKMRGRA